MKELLFALLAVAVSPPLFAQTSGTITSNQLVCIGVSADHSTVGVQVTGTWTGTLQPQVAIQGQALTNSQVVPSTSNTPQATITANGVYYANVGSASQFCILGNTVASGSAVVFLNAAKGVNASTLGGGGGIPGQAFGIRNYGCIADDATDNATCFANWAAAVNAYAGAGIPEARCDMGPGDKAYLTSAGVIFTIPVYVAGNCTIDAKSTYAGVVIQLGASGRAAFDAAGMPPYTVDGLTFIGGAGGATGIQVQGYISNSRIIRNTFSNFGSAATTSWPIATIGANNEIHISDNHIWSYDATAGRNGIQCADTLNQPSDSCEIYSNTIAVAQPPSFTGPCGGTGLYLDGSHVHVFSNDIFGFNNDIRIANSSTGTNKDYVIEFNALDSDGCANGTVKSAIQLGSAGNVTNTINDVFLHGNQLSPRTGLTLFDVAGDNTYGGVNLFGNVRATENFCVTCSTQAITSVSGYKQGRDNWSFTGTDAGTNNTPSFLQPLILGTISTPTAPASGKHAFFLPSSGNDAGLLCAVNNGGGVYCYAAGPTMVTASIGGSSVPANSCADTAVTVTGANNAFNEMAVVGPVGALAANWANFTWTGYVSAANTAQVHICNVTAGALTPTAMTFAIKVIQ